MPWDLGLFNARGARLTGLRRGFPQAPRWESEEETPFDAGLSHWNDVSIDDIPLVPGMTQPDELKYFFWCCATKHRPGRRVIELGPYVGRSTMAMAAGMRRSAEPDGRLVSIDRFCWEAWTLQNTLQYTLDGLSKSQRARLTPVQLNPKLNDSFLPFFEVFTEPLKDSIDAVNTMLESYRWTGEPIDVLMIDAAKTWEAWDQIIRQFFPCLIDGAVVIHQDYKHFFTYWLHPVTERMLERGVLTLAENVAGTPTQGFRFRKRSSFRAEDYVRGSFSNRELDRLMARSTRRFPGASERLAVTGAACRMLCDMGQVSRARAAFLAAMREGGFADNYALDDLLMMAQEWARPLTRALLENSTMTCNGRERGNGVRSAGIHSVAIPAPADAEPAVVELPKLDTNDAIELAMNLWADCRGAEPVWLRIQAFDRSSHSPFYDDEFLIGPGVYQPAIVPLSGRSKIALRLTTSCPDPASAMREIHCIAPMLIASV